MKFRLFALLVVLPAFVAGMLVAAPAEAAAKYNLYVSSKSVALSSGGQGKVLVKCKGNRACRGKLTFGGDSRVRSYSVRAGKSAFIKVALNKSAAAYPYDGTSRNGQYRYKNAFLNVNEDSPRNVTHRYRVVTETIVSTQQIQGDINGSYPDSTGHMSDLKVELISAIRGGNSKVMATKNVTDGGSYSINVRLSSNNGPSPVYRLRISGVDRDGLYRSFMWRGRDGNAAGGGRYLNEGSGVQARKTNNYEADFNYSSITGTSNYPSNTKIRVAAPPVSMPSGATARRELDLASCANTWADVDVLNGRYRVDFLPYEDTRATKQYMVSAKHSNVETWNNAFGSCLDTVDYRGTHTNLLAFSSNGTPLVHNVTVRLSKNTLLVAGRSKGFKATSADRWIRLREKVPGLPVLAAPVVAEGASSSSLRRTFTNVPPGRYWVEVGRRTGCSMWLPSKFPNNNNYFNGLDRTAEKWKTVSGRVEEFKRSVAMGYKRKTPPRGYRGWMYRDVCKALGAGTYNTVNVSGYGKARKITTTTVRKGAIVKGHISRAKGRTNKEMLVRLTTTSGTRVVRSDVTDSSGNFYVAGLASGSYTISVNSDSWRGIGRKFTGRHSVKVKLGKIHNVRTLKFRD